MAVLFWAFTIFPSIGAYRMFKRTGAAQPAVQADCSAFGGPAA